MGFLGSQSLTKDHLALGSRHTGKIPNSKKPKPRPPRGWRDKVIFPVRSLPNYTGPYPVGTMEIEVPAENPRTFSDIKRNGRHLLQLETVLMTVYYPAIPVGLEGEPHDHSRQLWIGRPRVRIAQGYGRLSGFGPLAVPVFLPTMFTKLPAYRNSPVANYWAPNVDTKTRGFRVKLEQGSPPQGASDEPVFPLILFSHGLCGTRTMYSSVCGEFASYGFVVCAVEHRDGSGPRTYINHPSRAEVSKSQSEKINNLDHTPHQTKQGVDVIDYCFPKGNPNDTMPNNEKGVDAELRQAQTELRMAELEEAYRIICMINDGDGQLVADRNLRREGHKGSSTHGLKGIDWRRWTGRFNPQNVTICGHSFGAATATEMLRSSDRFDYISQGIIYDMWGAAAPKLDDPKRRIRAPIIAINSEAFTYWPLNYEVVEKIVQEVQSGPDPSPSWLITLRGTVHVSQSDFSILYPGSCSWFLKMVANPQRALDININASLEFLSHVLPADLAQVNRSYQNEKFLESKVTTLERIPSAQMHKPKQKFLAMKLDIRHEWIYRISPKLFRQFKRWDNERRGKAYEPGDEVWLHIKPSADIIKEHLRNTPGRSTNRDEDFYDILPPITDTTTDEGAAPSAQVCG